MLGEKDAYATVSPTPVHAVIHRQRVNKHVKCTFSTAKFCLQLQTCSLQQQLFFSAALIIFRAYKMNFAATKLSPLYAVLNIGLFKRAECFEEEEELVS